MLCGHTGRAGPRNINEYGARRADGGREAAPSAVASIRVTSMVLPSPAVNRKRSPIRGANVSSVSDSSMKISSQICGLGSGLQTTHGDDGVAVNREEPRVVGIDLLLLNQIRGNRVVNDPNRPERPHRQ